MKVELINHTQNALELLLRTKNTRLAFKEDPATWSAEKKAEHLAYMRDTIRSSWEFCDYVFELSGVTRAFTHQLVRTRTGAYAQESQRTVDVREHPVAKPQSIASSANANEWWDEMVGRVKDFYADLVDGEIPVQDARGILPTNMTTSIVAKFNLRTLHDMAKVRLCTRTQGEYQDVFREMRRRVIEVHPWVEQFGFIEVHCVSEGTCAFPRYGRTSCQFWDARMDLTSLREETRIKFWSTEKQVAVPVAHGGKTM